MCRGSGFRGRIGLYEILEVSEDMRALISKSASSSEIRKLAEKQGFQAMLMDGIHKVQSGQTTIGEVFGAISD
jgi:general secretion pathway protein E